MNDDFFKGFCIGFLTLAAYGFIMGFIQAYLKDKNGKSNE